MISKAFFVHVHLRTWKQTQLVAKRHEAARVFVKRHEAAGVFESATRDELGGLVIGKFQFGTLSCVLTGRTDDICRSRYALS